MVQMTQTTGSGGHLLILMWDFEDLAITDKIREHFPDLSVTWFCLQSASEQLREEAKTTSPGIRSGRYVFNELLSPSRHDFDAETLRARDLLKELLFKSTVLVTLSLLPHTVDDAPHLKFVHILSAGADMIVNQPFFRDTDVDFTTSSGIHGIPLGEWVIMNALAFRRGLLPAHKLQKDHQWPHDKSLFFNAADLHGRRVGILGYGSIGRQVGRLFAALGCSVLAYTASPRLDSESRKDRGYVIPGSGDPNGSFPSRWFSGTDKQSIHAFLAQDLDILVLAVPLTPSTRHMISASELELMHETTNPPGKCFLINIARGEIIHQPALIEALNHDQLAGAALDVTVPEPLPANSALWDAKNITITPHIGSLGLDYQMRAFDILIVNLTRRERGEKLLNLINRRKGY